MPLSPDDYEAFLRDFLRDQPDPAALAAALKGRCAFCGEPATLLCDHVLGWRGGIAGVTKDGQPVIWEYVVSYRQLKQAACRSNNLSGDFGLSDWQPHSSNV